MNIVLLIALGSALVMLVSQRMESKKLRKELGASKERFKLVFDILWMQVRDKNDLTYDGMASLVVAMQESPIMPAVRETLERRITGQDKKRIGFGQ